MSRIFQVKSIKEYNERVGQETLHPLVSVIDFSNLPPEKLNEARHLPAFKLQMDFYAIFLKDVSCGNLTYGLNTYDYEKGTLIFIAPGQVFGADSLNESNSLTGTAILFHPDLLHNSNLGRHIRDYSFFSYEANEALHLSQRERKSIDECISNMKYELEHAIDAHSKTIIISYLELLLNMSRRFYERQFNTRSHVNKDILVRFEKVLNNYLYSGQPLISGLPTVNYCADKLHISPNYLGDLLKNETGKSAREHIQLKIVEVAKGKIFDTEKSVSQVAYDLGFKHPQHFSRMFKKSVGISPTEYKNLN